MLKAYLAAPADSLRLAMPNRRGCWSHLHSNSWMHSHARKCHLFSRWGNEPPGLKPLLPGRCSARLKSCPSRAMPFPSRVPPGCNYSGDLVSQIFVRNSELPTQEEWVWEGHDFSRAARD